MSARSPSRFPTLLVGLVLVVGALSPLPAFLRKEPRAAAGDRDGMRASTALVSEAKASLGVHPYYVGGSADRSKLEDVAVKMFGEPSALAWLEEIARRAVREARREESALREDVEWLERRLAPGPDILVLASGELKEGSIVEETDAAIVLKMRIGKAEGRRAFRREGVREVWRGSQMLAEFRERLGRAGSSMSDLEALLAWCASRRLAVARQLVAARMLLENPSHEAARLELGYRKGPGGLWKRTPVVRREGNRVWIDGREMAREGVSEFLTKRGYVQVGGAWCEEEPWCFSIEEAGGTLPGRMENVLTAHERRGTEERRMLVAAPERKGRVALSVAAPGLIVRCRVRAPGAVLGNGALAVEVSAGADRRRVLYRRDVSGSVDRLFDVTDVVEGRRSFEIEAELVGDAAFLISRVGAERAFEVFGSVAVPVAGLEDLR